MSDTVTLYRIDRSGTDAQQGRLLYLNRPDEPAERTVTAVTIELPEGWIAWTNDGAAYGTTARGFGFQFTWDSYDGQVVAVDATGSDIFATRPIAAQEASE